MYCDIVLSLEDSQRKCSVRFTFGANPYYECLHHTHKGQAVHRSPQDHYIPRDYLKRRILHTTHMSTSSRESTSAAMPPKVFSMYRKGRGMKCVVDGQLLCLILDVEDLIHNFLQHVTYRDAQALRRCVCVATSPTVLTPNTGVHGPQGQAQGFVAQCHDVFRHRIVQ